MSDVRYGQSGLDRVGCSSKQKDILTTWYTRPGAFHQLGDRQYVLFTDISVGIRRQEAMPTNAWLPNIRVMPNEIGAGSSRAKLDWGAREG